MQEKASKKILLVTRPIAPPWDEASKNFAYYLAKNTDGFEFGLLTNGIIPDLPENICQKSIYTSNNFGYLQKIRLIKYLRKIKNEFDILHYIFTPTKQNTFLLKHFVGYEKNNSIKRIQTIATLREDLYSDNELKRLIFGDLVITYSDYAKNKLNSLGFNNVKRVYPGIDLSYYSPASKNNELAANYKLQSTDFIVTYPGEYARLNAVDDIVNVIIKYPGVWKDKNIKFIFACRLKNNKDIIKKEEVMKKIAKYGLADTVLFINTYPDMAKLYNLSDAIIFPVCDMQGKFDVPLAVIEAMACERPVIISDLPILKEFANAENSVTIERGNIEQLKSAILDLCDDSKKRMEIGKNARKFCEENFDIKKVAEIYREIYGEL